MFVCLFVLSFLFPGSQFEGIVHQGDPGMVAGM